MNKFLIGTVLTGFEVQLKLLSARKYRKFDFWRPFKDCWRYIDLYEWFLHDFPLVQLPKTVNCSASCSVIRESSTIFQRFCVSERITRLKITGIRRCGESTTSKIRATVAKWPIGWCRADRTASAAARICPRLSKIFKKLFWKRKRMLWAKSRNIRARSLNRLRRRYVNNVAE